MEDQLLEVACLRKLQWFGCTVVPATAGPLGEWRPDLVGHCYYQEARFACTWYDAWFGGRCKRMKAKNSIAHRHCIVGGHWDYSMCEKGWGPAEVEEESKVINVPQRPIKAAGMTIRLWHVESRTCVSLKRNTVDMFSSPAFIMTFFRSSRHSTTP